MLRRIAILAALVAATTTAAHAQAPNRFLIANSSSGTTLYTITKLTATGSPSVSVAVIAANTDTSGIIGITIAGAGTSGEAVVQISGPVPCVFDGATTADDYVQISSTVGGDCHDTGSTNRPASGVAVGRVLLTNAGPGTYTILEFPPDVAVTSGGNVTSVFGRMGDVVAATNDYTCAQVTNCAQISGATTNAPLYATSATTGTSGAALTNGQLEIGSTSNPPVAATPTGTSPITVTAGAGTLAIACATCATSTSVISGATNNGVVYATGTNTATSTGAPTNGQIPIGSTGNPPVLSTITAGSGATVINGAGSITVATTATVRQRGFGTTFGDTGGSALTSGSVVYFTIPYACTIGGWNITADAGTVTFDIWKIATGTAIPTVTNTITASALPALASGTAIHSTTLTGWTTSVAADDIFGVQLKTVATAKYVEIDLECAQ